MLPSSVFAESQIRSKLDDLGSQCQIVLLWVNLNMKLKGRERGGWREGERGCVCVPLAKKCATEASPQIFFYENDSDRTYPQTAKTT